MALQRRSDVGWRAPGCLKLGRAISSGDYDLRMAICAVCGQEMLTASSCSERYAELVDGRYERIRWGALEGEPTDESCGDCGVDPGGLHHVGCEFETCPRCREALALCDCWPE